MRTITAMFDSRADAETARNRLTAAGISVTNVSIHDKSSLGDSSARYQPGSSGAHAQADGRDGVHRNAIGDYVDNRTGDRLMEDAGSERTLLGDYVEGEPNNKHADTTDHHDDGPGLWAQIKAFFTGDDAVYEEGMRRGGYVVIARVADHEAENVIDILDDDGTVDLGSREADWRRDGWSDGAATLDREQRRRIGSYASDDLYR